MKKIIIIVLIIVIINLSLTVFVINKIKVVEGINKQIPDTIFNKIQIDSIQYNINRIDSEIININKYENEIYNKVMSANDSATWELFKKLVNE